MATNDKAVDVFFALLISLTRVVSVKFWKELFLPTNERKHRNRKAFLSDKRGYDNLLSFYPVLPQIQSLLHPLCPWTYRT